MLWFHLSLQLQKVTAETNPDTLIGAPQAEVDLEAQPVSFPPMPDTLDVEFNPWTLPRG
jgi:hypothetical protein